MSSMAKGYPALTKVLNLYARSKCSNDFEWTTITVNDGFASARHRDSGNAGLSFIKTVGDYEGGDLFAWPSDDGRKTLGSLAYGEADTLDPRTGVYFYGTRARNAGILWVANLDCMVRCHASHRHVVRSGSGGAGLRFSSPVVTRLGVPRRAVTLITLRTRKMMKGRLCVRKFRLICRSRRRWYMLGTSLRMSCLSER